MNAKIKTIIIILFISITGLFAQNNCLDFDGTNDYVAADGVCTILNNPTEFSMECWFKTTDVTADQYFLAFNNNDFSNNLQLGINNGTLKIYDSNTVTTGSDLSNNTWYHAAMTVTNGNTVTVYLNGVVDITLTSITIRPESDGYFSIAQEWDGSGASNFFGGSVDEVRVWNDVRTETEIRQNLFRELNGDESNLAAYYKCNAASGTTLDDATSNNNDGTLTNMDNSDWITSSAIFGPKNCLDLDGTDDYVDLGGSTDLKPTIALTAEAWVNMDDWTPDTERKKIISNTQSGGWALSVSADNRIELEIYNGSTYITPYFSSVGLSGWHHIAGIFDGSDTYLYVDGCLKSTISMGASSISYSTTTNSTIIGAEAGSGSTPTGNYMNGMVDELRVWNIARTASQIRDNMSKILTGNESGLVAYYNFDNSSGTTLQDFSGDENEGTLTNMEDADWVSSSAFNTWLNVDNSNWSTATNWSRGSAPVSIDNVGIVNYSGGNDPTLSGSSTINTLNMAANSSLTMNADLNVNNALVMAGNNITTGSNTLTVGSGAISVGNVARSSGTVIGNLKRWFAASTVSDAIFPIGTSSNYRPSNISFTSMPTTEGTITASYNATDPGDAGLPLNDGGYTINTTAPDGYWSLTSADGLTGGTYSLDITADAFTGVSDYTTLHLVKRANSSSDWTVDGTHSAGTGSNGTPVVHRTGMTSFSEFGVGSNSTDNSLPVELSSFTANAGDGLVTLKWTTASEVDNEAFILERGTDGDNFELLAEIKGQGSTSSETNYSFTDNAVFNGFTYYYRLADRDINGVVTWHTTINATPNAKGIDFESTGLVVEKFALHTNYPNPFNPETTIRFAVPTVNSDLKAIKLNIYNSVGQLITTLYEGQISGGQYEMKWNAVNQPSGVYFLNFQSDQFVQSQKMILLR